MHAARRTTAERCDGATPPRGTTRRLAAFAFAAATFATRGALAATPSPSPTTSAGPASTDHGSTPNDGPPSNDADAGTRETTTAGNAASSDAASSEAASSEPAPVVLPPTVHEPGSTGTPSPSTPLLTGREAAGPPPTNVVYLQYGVALGAEVVSSAGAICHDGSIPCILGTGGGITVRAGFRSNGPFYFGGAYAFSKQDPNKLFRLAILQQARAEARYYFQTARDVEPYAQLGAGVAGYGNEWSVDTYGPAGSFGGGLEVQVTRRTVVGVAACYRLLLLKSFTDSSGAARDGGIAQFVGLDLVLEQRDPIFTTRDR